MSDCEVAQIRWQSLTNRGVVLAVALKIICYGTLLAAQAAPQQLDPRASALLKAFKDYESALRQLDEEALKKQSKPDIWEEQKKLVGDRLLKDVVDPEAPWAPYLAEPFTNGLSSTDRARELDAQERGDCPTVLLLARQGFFNLYPFLKPAIEQNFSVQLMFQTIVARHSAQRLRRCEAYGRLNRAMTEFARHGKEPELLDNLFPYARPERRQDHDPAQLEWCQGVLELYELAITRDFVPAQRDLLKFLAEPARLSLPPSTEYYLLERTGHRGLKVADAEARYVRIRATLRTKAQKRIEQAARTGDAALARLPYWDCHRFR